MKKHELLPNEIAELLTPLINFTMMKKYSVSLLKNNPEDFAKKIKTEGKPIALTYNVNVIALLCDPSVYKQTEERRRRLVALLEDAPSEFIPTVGRRPMSPSEHQNIRELKQCIARIEKLEDSINSTKCGLYDLEEELHKITEKKLKLIPKVKPILLTAK